MFLTILLALAPTAALIALGQGLRRIVLVHDSFWPQAERLVYYVLLPALFFHGLATAHLGDLPVREMAITLVCSTCIVAALLVMASPWLGLPLRTFKMNQALNQRRLLHGCRGLN